MTPKELLQKLEALGSIEAKALRKIRIQVEDPQRIVKTSAVLSYLVRKGQLTEEQARQLMKGETPAGGNRGNTEELMLNVLDDEPVAEGQGKEETETIQSNVPNSRTMSNQFLSLLRSRKWKSIPPRATSTAIRPGSMSLARLLSPKRRLNHRSVARLTAGDQWSSRWPYIGFGLLGFLVMVGGFLYFTVNNMKPEAMYNNAKDHYENRSYQAAIKGYDEYIEAAPNHKFIKEAKARRVQSFAARFL